RSWLAARTRSCAVSASGSCVFHFSTFHFFTFHASRRERRRRAYREKLFDILDQNVVFDVDGVTGLLETERRGSQRVGNQFDGKVAVLDRKDGQADPVDGDRALLDQVARLRGRDLEAEEF